VVYVVRLIRSILVDGMTPAFFQETFRAVYEGEILVGIHPKTRVSVNSDKDRVSEWAVRGRDCRRDSGRAEQPERRVQGLGQITW